VITLTAEMRAAAARRMGVDELDPWTVAAIVDVLAIADRHLRAVIAGDIKAALAADEADSDVTSGEAIWEQCGYRRGLDTAAEIVEGAAT
jgi:hypothetical protein